MEGYTSSPFDAIRHVDAQGNEQIQTERYYTYIYAYPDGKVFYVGKGQGDRILAHELEAKKGGQSEKCRIIRSIWAKGEEVQKIKLAFYDEANDAYRDEACLIASLDGLANIIGGRKTIKDAYLAIEDHWQFGASIRQVDEDGFEFFTAREIADFFGYSTWDKFNKLVKSTMKILQEIGWNLTEHVVPTFKIVQIGHGSKRKIIDYRISPMTFLMLVQRADVEKPMVSIGKNYIARQVLRAEGHPLPEKKSFQQLQREEQQRLKRGGQQSLFEPEDE